MITDIPGLVKHIADWITERAKEAGAESLIVGISGGVDSAVIAGLCAQTGLPTHGVRMPCHSSPSSLARGQEVISKFGLTGHTIDLGPAFESIKGQAVMDANVNNAAAGALRSCLRAPTLDFFGKLYNGLIVGTGNRDEDEVTRYFQKRGDGCVDFSPIAKLHKSEIYELAKYLNVPASVIEAKPTADLWGPDSGQEDEKELGLSYAEVEWGIRVGDVYSKGQSVQETHFNAALVESADLFDEREKFVLNTLARMERVSRHKANPNLPVCEVREQFCK